MGNALAGHRTRHIDDGIDGPIGDFSPSVPVVRYGFEGEGADHGDGETRDVPRIHRHDGHKGEEQPAPVDRTGDAEGETGNPGEGETAVLFVFFQFFHRLEADRHGKSVGTQQDSQKQRHISADHPAVEQEDGAEQDSVQQQGGGVP